MSDRIEQIIRRAQRAVEAGVAEREIAWALHRERIEPRAAFLAIKAGKILARDRRRARLVWNV